MKALFTCRGCNVPYTDATSSGAKTKKNCGYCSKACREDSKKTPPKQCEHGRQPSRCKDCGTGFCKHGRRKDQCKDCDTGHCQHGRQKSQCKDCRSKAIGKRQ
jgi:hypothetical protein